MVVCGQYNSASGASAPPISDTLNSSWSSCLFFVGGTANQYLFWAIVPTGGGANTISLGNAAADLLGIVILEYTITAGYTVHVDQAPAEKNGTASATPTTPQITTTVASELIVAGFGFGGNNWATAAPLTQRQAITYSGGTYAVVGDDIVSTIQTNQTWSATQTSSTYQSYVISFYATAPASANNNRLMMMGVGT